MYFSIFIEIIHLIILILKYFDMKIHVKDVRTLP